MPLGALLALDEPPGLEHRLRSEVLRDGHAIENTPVSLRGQARLTRGLLSAWRAPAMPGTVRWSATERSPVTTTRRALYLIPGGCLVLDTPGMRELQLADTASGIADTFEDIQTLAAQCRFGNCQHESEPGCAVRDAIEHGRLDPARLHRWRKLMAEDSFNSASLAERRTKDRAFGKMVRTVMKDAKSRRRP